MINSNSPIDKSAQRFRNLVLTTVLIIYLVILAGGIVRGTGSGMGCPDWPKCFGRWVPPTTLSQLPVNYQEIYGAKLKGEVKFNAVKTWIEYVNRLLGVLSGLFVFTTLVASFSYLHKDKFILWGSIVAFLLIGVNGWLGSRVVATELAQYMITLHLLLAILVVFALLFVLVRSNSQRIDLIPIYAKRSVLQYLLLAILILTMGQIVLGTQVRDSLDEVVRRIGYGRRDYWISNLDWRFYIHRSFSLIVMAFHIAVLYQLQKLAKSSWLTRLTKVLMALVIAEIATGISLAYLGVPAVAQPIHLLLSILIIGLQFSIWLLITPALRTPKAVFEESGFIN